MLTRPTDPNVEKNDPEKKRCVHHLGARHSSPTHPWAPPQAPEGKGDAARIQVASDFDSIWSSVTELGASTFKGRDKKIWEARKLEGLGLRVKHKEKMPRKMWMGVKAKREAKAARAAQEAKEADLVTGKGAVHAKLTPRKGKGRFKADPSKSLETGAFRNGVLRVKPPGPGSRGGRGRRRQG